MADKQISDAQWIEYQAHQNQQKSKKLVKVGFGVVDLVAVV
ncbi:MULTISPECIES: hypothetical protein [Staphylococcus]|nr:MULTISPECIES: hypothetical protein [Staphylococcus]MDT3968388.1 hypothetical protein [Staphylococcus saprophyticus]MDT3971789.1 hypothetical protein [Staphylococcus saprophyticus]MDT3979325.1 hypothetical protein [Staphylococcus saprophyticus]MDT3986374.1 hypothetical protein [Staphylococcus saprophyticus]MDT3997708.1 hypothetical protein [Staphylococcus saprophyticus]